MAGWSNKSSKVTVERVEKVFDTDPDLYIKRMDYFIQQNNYGAALKECEMYRRVGGNEDLYLSNRQMICELQSGKHVGFTKIEQELISILEKQGIRTTGITPYSKMKSLDMDSLDAFEVVMAIEEKYGIEIPPEDASELMRYPLRQNALWLSRRIR